VAVPAALPGRAEVLAVVVRVVRQLIHALDRVEQLPAEYGLELRPHEQGPPGVHDPERGRVLVAAVAVAVEPVGAGSGARPQLRHSRSPKTGRSGSVRDALTGL